MRSLVSNLEETADAIIISTIVLESMFFLRKNKNKTTEQIEIKNENRKSFFLRSEFQIIYSYLQKVWNVYLKVGNCLTRELAYLHDSERRHEKFQKWFGNICTYWGRLQSNFWIEKKFYVINGIYVINDIIYCRRNALTNTQWMYGNLTMFGKSFRSFVVVGLDICFPFK